MTLRETAKQNVIDSVTEAATKQHERNYEKLHVYRDGTVSWFESINRTDDIVDRHADSFQAIPSVCTVGTGGYACNCDHCNDPNYATLPDAIAGAVGDSDLSDTEKQMLSSLGDIPLGYFNDEAESDIERARR